MREKKGFIAISLLYAFFLIFLMLMVAILATATQNRILVGALKQNIRTSIESITNETLLFDTIKTGQAYEVGQKALFGGENWFVIQNSEASAPTVTLVLARALRIDEIKKCLDVTKVGSSGIGVEYEPSELPDFYVNEGGQYKLRGCRMLTAVITDGMNLSSQLCYRFNAPTNVALVNSQYSAPVFGVNFIPQKVATKWFNTHPMLRLLTARIKTSTIGSATNLYVRLPSENDVIYLPNNHQKYDEENDWGEDWIRNIYPFHLSDGMGTHSILIATMDSPNYKVDSVPSYSGAYIRPVIEVYKA